MALAVLITTTGCRMTNGERREPIDVGEYIAREAVYNTIGKLKEVDIALIADWYLSTDDEVLREEICDRLLPYNNDYEVHFENDTVRVLYRYIYKPRDEERVTVVSEFVTNGKLLSEGGEWGFVHGALDGSKIISNGDESYDIINKESQEGSTLDLQLSNIELDIKSGITYDVDGGFGVAYHDTTADSNIYLSYNTKITEPLKYIHAIAQLHNFKSGAIHVECDDKRDGRHDVVDIRFTKSRTAEVLYLGEVGSIEY